MEPDEIRATRDRLGLTQAQFGALLGLQAATVSRWENPNDHLRPTAYQVGVIRMLDTAGRRRPRPRDATNDIVLAIVGLGAVVAMAILLAQALEGNHGPQGGGGAQGGGGPQGGGV